MSDTEITPDERFLLTLFALFESCELDDLVGLLFREWESAEAADDAKTALSDLASHFESRLRVIIKDHEKRVNEKKEGEEDPHLPHSFAQFAREAMDEWRTESILNRIRALTDVDDEYKEATASDYTALFRTATAQGKLTEVLRSLEGKLNNLESLNNPTGRMNTLDYASHDAWGELIED